MRYTIITQKDIEGLIQSGHINPYTIDHYLVQELNALIPLDNFVIKERDYEKFCDDVIQRKGCLHDNAELPQITYDHEAGLWEMVFHGTDEHGNDSTSFTYYFKNIQDIITSCVKFGEIY